MESHFRDPERKILQRFEEMLKTNTVYFFDSEDFMDIVRNYIDGGKISLAKKALTIALEQHPDIIELHLLSAELLLLEERYSEVATLLDELENIEPTNGEIFIQKATLSSQQERHTEAVAFLKKALEYLGEHNDILYLLGMEYLYLDDFKNALFYYKKCLELDALDQASLSNIVYCYEMLEKPEKAIAFLETYIEKEPYYELAWHHLGNQYRRVGNYFEALKAYDYALAIDELFIGAYTGKAKIYKELGFYKEAIENYLIILKLGDPNAITFLELGNCYQKNNESEKAREYYLKSCEQDPYLDKPLIALVSLYLEEESYQKAIHYAKKLVALDDKNANFWRLYAQTNLKAAFFEEAVYALQKCLELGKDSLKVYITLADTHYFIGDHYDAIEVLQRAENKYFRSAEIKYRLAGLYFFTKRTEMGVENLTMALKIQPESYREFQKLFPTLHNNPKFKTFLESCRK